MSNLVDFPFYREIEEYKLGLRPPIERFAIVVVFALCAMLAGTIVGLEQGRRPVLSARDESVANKAVQSRLAELQNALESHFPQSLQLPDYRVIVVGDQLEVHFSTSIMFAGGQAKLSGADGDTLHQLALALLPVAKSAKIKFEAFTDDAPPSSTNALYPTNWELSGARAARVLRIFAKAGFPQENLTFVGWGETYPLVPNRDANGEPIPENRLKNRRMVVRVLAGQ